MAEPGGLPKRKVDEEDDGADALQKRRRISGSNFHEERLPVVPISSSQEEQDQSKNQEIEVAGAKKKQDRAKIYQEICDIMAQKDNQVITEEDFLRNQELEHARSTSEQEFKKKRKEEVQRKWEEATGAGRNDQPDVEGANPEPQEPPYFDSPF
ncbi:hypothetical protein AMTRI_Chr06g197420 [Amborella trichopoda]|uniref:Uncharacterized protein n=1 Tax=Amborella trichopoda TaxID=13333 RepID=W1PGV5_AMBTC|nr:hypothetical protein AMTR_s00005p00264730 [Amborella trichopoda]